MGDEDFIDDDQAERRDKNDRRDFKSSLSNSSNDTDELVINRDRRKMPERRLNNIQVEETEIVEDEFFEYMESYKNQKR